MPSSPVSSPKWPPVSQASKPTNPRWQTNKQGRRPSEECSSVRPSHKSPLAYTCPLLSIAGLGAGVTEAVLVVTPMEVVKIRLQAQSHSLADPLEIPRYRNAAHCAYTIVREEGFSTLYRGVTLTALRQATNQGAWS